MSETILIQKRLENLFWHIENNREVAGDTGILNEVLFSLQNMVKEIKELEERVS
ncbi:hypothetical protein [Bacillus sp. SM2101]|uniref:hypothetical protein n=1 Tax=Bacillus sp. SM2101 TaxID=2805366 RepID=UPI001BDE4A7E|nr:hypothetical protein [Bacillus sp. SM2101]